MIRRSDTSLMIHIHARSGSRSEVVGKRDGKYPKYGIGDVKTVATITGGTGRFADAAGTFTALLRASHDASDEGEFSGSFSGHLSLNH